MAAAFGYTKEHVKRELSLLDVYGHIAYYNDNPPAGTMIKAILASFFGEPAKPKQPQVSDSLDDLINDFAGCGGVLK
jgi:hypothetical protein